MAKRETTLEQAGLDMERGRGVVGWCRVGLLDAGAHHLVVGDVADLLGRGARGFDVGPDGVALGAERAGEEGSAFFVWLVCCVGKGWGRGMTRGTYKHQ
jgi:hypothetical protein